MQPFSKLRILVLAALPLASIAQQSSNSQTLAVPLSEPGKKGQLELETHNGSITVIGYSGKEVVVEAIQADRAEAEEISTKPGLRKISATGLGITIEERANRVRIETDDNHQRRVDYIIQVPMQFSLKLKAHNHGKVVVENVSGEMEITSHNGGVTLTGVGGSAWVETHNGGIRAEFKEVMPDAPMSFKTYNGDVELSLPASYKALAEFRPGKGEVFSDFEVKLRKNEPVVASRDAGSGVYKVVLKDELVGQINGGGPALSLETHNGNLYVKKK